jgi:RND superfamily putative drug exporter
MRVTTQDGRPGHILALHGNRALVALDDAIEDAIDLPAKLGVWVRTTLLAPAIGGAVAAGHKLDEVVPVFASPPPPEEQRGLTLFHRLGLFLYDAREIMVVGGIVAALGLLPLSATAPKVLTMGGFSMPNGEAAHVERIVHKDFKQPTSGVVVMVKTPDPERTKEVVEQLGPQLLEVEHVVGAAPPRTSPDGTAILVNIGLDTGDDEGMFLALEGIRKVLSNTEHTQISLTGRAVFAHDVNLQMQDDLHRAEIIGIPVALVVLLLVFGTVPAAFTALFVGSISTFITLAVIHVFGLTTDVSLFVLNIATLLGFGLGIDYSLLTIERFRQEMVDLDGDVRVALARATDYAGRTVVVSGVAIVLGFSGLLAFDIPGLKSIAIGGMIAVATTVSLTLILVPALLGMWGHRIEYLAVRKRRNNGSPAWRRIAMFVMKHPVVVLVCVGGFMITMSLPALHAQLDLPTPQMLPSHLESRVGQKKIEAEFDERMASPVLVLADRDTGDGRAALQLALRDLPNVARVDGPVGEGKREMYVLYAQHDSQGGPRARQLVRDVRKLNGRSFDPKGGKDIDILVGGQFASELEFFDEMLEGLPLALSVVLGSAFLVLLIAFRSVVVPLKAIVLDVLSICTTIGIIVSISEAGWIGHSGMIEANLPLLLFCLLFGLSMDYEVFMLAKVAENWQMGLKSDEATAEALASIAPLVTGAAMILVVLGLSFATTELVLVKQIGIGVAIALLIDATIMRAFLVPAAMRLLGDLNWWCPPWLARRVPRARWA